MAACSAFAQTVAIPSDAAFRSTVREVRVTFSATDRNDHAVTGLQSSDFAVVDRDLVVRQFRSFTRTEFTRLDVVVLFDASQSITPQFRQELADAVQFLTQAVEVPDASVSVIAFRDLKPVTVCSGNCRAMMSGGQFLKIESGGLTPLYDAVVEASRQLGRNRDPRVRRVVLVFSDGADTISLNSFGDALDSALVNDVAVYTVDVSRQPHNMPGSLVLRSLSVNTGGRYFTVETGSAPVVAAVLEDFHSAYTVAYKLPSRRSGFHQIRILPSHDLSLRFHCRRGYSYSDTEEN